VAVEKNNLEIIKLLLAQPKIDINIINDDSKTPLYWAIIDQWSRNIKNYNFEEITKLLIDKGASLHKADDSKGIEDTLASLFHQAIINIEYKRAAFPQTDVKISDVLERVRYLIEQDARVSDKNETYGVVYYKLMNYVDFVKRF
jgi:ankyrin repeat protein